MPPRRPSADSELFETLDSVFPYPYRVALGLLSKSYRAQVRSFYRAQPRRVTVVDATLSLIFFVGEIAFLLGLIWLLLR